MATQYTAGITQGQVWTAAIANQIGAVWEEYTPAWTGSVTNPAIGNGTIAGRYARLQKIIIAQGIIIVGSTTTFGAGGYRISVPITARADAFLPSIGMGLDASAGYAGYSGGGIWVTNTTLEFRIGDNITVWAPTVPFTFANADQFRWTAIYEAA